MPTQKRQRKREGRQVRQSALAARQRAARRRRTVVAGGLVGLLILGIAAVVSGGGGGGEAASKTTTTQVGHVSVPPGQKVSGATPCPPADGSSGRTTSFTEAPPICIDPAKAYVAEIKTDKGEMTVALDAATAPQTVNNFVVLSRYHYFDGIGFHRIIPGFVVQGGDPKGDGTGGPGYTIVDEKPAAQYKPGSLAMANTGQPNSGGSQFFIITGPQGEALPPQYSLFGQVAQGMDVAKAIEAVGSADGTPTETVRIESVTIKES